MGKIKCLVLFILILSVSCKNSSNKQSKTHFNDTLNIKTEMKIKTNELMLLQDSFNRSGNYKYLDKYILKINILIKEYPNHDGFKQTKEQMLEMFGDSITVK